MQGGEVNLSDASGNDRGETEPRRTSGLEICVLLNLLDQVKLLPPFFSLRKERSDFEERRGIGNMSERE